MNTEREVLNEVEIKGKRLIKDLYAYLKTYTSDWDKREAVLIPLGVFISHLQTMLNFIENEVEDRETAQSIREHIRKEICEKEIHQESKEDKGRILH